MNPDSTPDPTPPPGNTTSQTTLPAIFTSSSTSSSLHRLGDQSQEEPGAGHPSAMNPSATGGSNGMGSLHLLLNQHQGGEDDDMGSEMSAAQSQRQNQFAQGYGQTSWGAGNRPPGEAARSQDDPDGMMDIDSNMDTAEPHPTNNKGKGKSREIASPSPPISYASHRITDDAITPPGGTSTAKEKEKEKAQRERDAQHKSLMSPPTPAPSPTPGRNGWWGTVARDGSSSGSGVGEGSESDKMDGGNIENFDPATLLQIFPSLPPPTRLRLLEDLLPLLSTPELVMLSANIGPRLKRDFLRELPVELALHILTFVDDPRTLARASLVSRHWFNLLQDEQTWKEMCERHRFQTTQSIPAVPTLGAARNAPDVAIVTRPTSAMIANGDTGRISTVIPSSTNSLTPAFGITGPEMFQASRVRRDSGMMETENDTGPAHGYPVINGVMQHPSVVGPDAAAAAIQAIPMGQPPMLVNAADQSQGPLAPAPVNTGMPPAMFMPSVHGQPGNIDPNATTAQHTGQTNGQLPPLPSVVAPSAAALAAGSASNLPLFGGNTASSSGPASVPATATEFGLNWATGPAVPTSNAFTFRSNYQPRSNSSGSGRSISVPEPIVTNRTSPSYGNRRIEGIDTKAPGFSYKMHFKKAYLTEMNWSKGGRLLSTHTSTDEGVVTSLVCNSRYIVIGMANSKIHVFEAERGAFVRTLSGHELGVWCLFLVGPGGGTKISNSENMDEDGSSDEDRTRLFGSPLKRGFSPSSPSSYSKTRVGNSRKRARNGTPRTATANLGASFVQGRNFGDGGRAEPGLTRSNKENALSMLPGHEVSTTGPFGYPVAGQGGKRFPSSDFCGSAGGWGQRGSLVVSGGCDRDVRVWDIETGECLHILRGHTSTLRCLKVLEGRPVAVSGSRDASLRVWDIEKGECLHHLTGHQHSVRCMEVAGNMAVSGSYDCTCRVWNLETGECTQVLRGHYHQIYAVAFDGERVATGSLDSTVRIWSAATGECVALLQGHTSLVGQLQLSGDILITGGSDGRVIIFDLATYTCLQRICAHDNSVTCLQFDDRFIVSAGNDGRVKLWDIKTGNFIRELSKPSEVVWAFNFKNDKCAILCKRQGKTVFELLSFVPEEGN